MRVCIFTFSKETNYGATLQCYALCKVFEQLGHEVQILDLQLNRFKESILTKIATLPKHLLFSSFRRKYFNYTRHYRSISDVLYDLPKAELFVVGSDQVWNPEITQRLSPLAYFFSFLDDNTKRISYAASFGRAEWRFKELNNRILPLIKKFNAVSVREESGINICQQEFGIEAKYVLDPTLLLSDYEEICGLYNPQKKKKRIAYFKFKRDAEILKISSTFARNHDLEISYINYFHRIPDFVYHPYSSVSGWLNSIRYSEFIITDSFHFMVFSIIFKKKFVVLPSFTGREERMTNLLCKLGLSQNFCSTALELEKKIEMIYNSNIDWDVVSSKLEILRKHSMAFIKNTIKQVSAK